MNIYGWALVIFVTGLAVMLGPVWWMDRRQPRIPLARLADPAPLPHELPRAGLLPLDHLPATGPSGPWLEPGPYGPFPVDTGPLLILSEKAAANVALERDVRAMIEAGEAKIPPRWR